MKDSRSATKPERTIVESVCVEMDHVLVENRYGGGSATKGDLLKRIADWRSRLTDAKP